MQDVQAEAVQWIWYPYIPKGKITVVQGDPGEGKTTLALSLVSLLTRGQPMPGSRDALPPMNVIYQTVEDGLSDTIKPRLTAMDADCSRVLVIDESEHALSMCDERLEQAICTVGAGLAILDPIQAYLGDGVDMHRANEIRPIFKQLALLAERTGCTILLIGHMNKMQGAKAAYRGLGSIDFRAAARSVLLVGRSKDDPTVRIVVHDKSSLAPEGRAVLFCLDGENGFSDITANDLLSGNAAVTKTAQAEQLLTELLMAGPKPSEELCQAALTRGISERTLKIAKQKPFCPSPCTSRRWSSTTELLISSNLIFVRKLFWLLQNR
ncbi:MAG: AAA family ATPase [Butyricicoccus sp.]